MKRRVLALVLAASLVSGVVPVSAATDANPSWMNLETDGKAYYFKEAKQLVRVSDADGINKVKVGSTTVKGEGKDFLDVSVSKSTTLTVTDSLGNKKSFKCVKDSKKPTIKYSVSSDRSTLTFVCKDSTSPINVSVCANSKSNLVWTKADDRCKTQTATLNLEELREIYPGAEYVCTVYDKAGNCASISVKDPGKSYAVKEASAATYVYHNGEGSVAKSTVYVQEGCDFVINEKNGLKSVKVGSKTIKCDGGISTTVSVSQSCTVKVTDLRGDTASMKIVVDSKKPTVSLSQSKGTLKVTAKDNAQLKTIYVTEGDSTIYKKDSKGKSATVSFDVSKYSGKKLTVSVYDRAGNSVEKEITIK